MEEYITGLKPLLDLALSEGINGMFYIVLGAVIGFSVSLVIIFSLYIYARRKSWPSREKWGRVSRVILLFYALVFVPITSAAVGATYGLISAISSSLGKIGLIEKATAEGLNQVVAIIYVGIESEINKSNLSYEQIRIIAKDYVSGEKKIPLRAIRDQMDYRKAGAVQEVVVKFKQKYAYEGDDAVARFGHHIAGRVLNWLAEAKVDSLYGSVDEVLGNMNKEEVTSKEMSFVFGRQFIKPYIEKKISEFKMTTLIMGIVQILLLLLPPVGILWLIGMIQNKNNVERVMQPDVVTNV